MDHVSGDVAEGDHTLRELLLLAGGLILIPALLITLLVAVVLAPAALMADGIIGGGNGCPTLTTASTTAALSATNTPSPTAASDCLNPNGNAIVSVALQMAAHLYGNPDVWYDSAFPPAALAYWQQTCPGCKEWQNGNLQCVMFALAAYGVAGIHPPAAGNAIKFWALYAHQPGWIEVPSAVAPPAQRGLPQPGDWMVWFNAADPFVGHIAVVVEVRPPIGSQAGSVTFAEANGPGPIVTETLLPDLSVLTWHGGYSVVGYIRHVG